MSAPEFNQTRQLLNKFNFLNIIDYGEFWFKWVKIETICIIFKIKPQKLISKNKDLKIESYIQKNIRFCSQEYIFDESYPNWLIYRDAFFDKVAQKMEFWIFWVFRDRQITKKNLQPHGKIRVLKSRNISSNKIIDIEWYDCYIDDISKFAIKKYINRNDILLIPNLTYNPRGCILPTNTITDWSVALLEKKITAEITLENIEYYASKEFKEFYMIARNYGTRSLNIDSNSVFYFGKYH